MPEHICLAIEGAIGVGKTTLARMLQPIFGAELLLEIFEENPFLSDFYADRERFAFQTQIFFLLSRYRQQREVQRIVQSQPLIGDYVFAKDRLFAHLNLHGDELEMYERLHNALAERIVVPDLVVYLRASPDVLMERIATRDRPYERTMSRAYIEALAAAYEEFFATYRETRLLIVDTNALNVVGDSADLEAVARQIREALAAAPAAAVAPERRAQAAVVPMPAPALASVGEGDPHTITELHLEFLALQRSLGDLASTLRSAYGRGPAAGSLSAGAELPGLRSALTDCLSTLQRMAALGRIGRPVV